MYIADEFLKEIEKIQKEYKIEQNSDKFKTAVYSVASKYSKYVTESIQNMLDEMEENEIDFEQEDEIYYESAQEELLSCMIKFVLDNRYRFRD